MFKIVSGTFLDGIACDIPSNNWTARDWTRQFDLMKDMGIDTAIIIRVGFGDSAMFKSSVMNTTLYEDPDLVELFFREGDRTGISMYLGLYDTTKFWTLNDWDAETEINLRLVDEMWPKYRNHPSFAGWYLSHEGDLKYHQTRIWKPLAKRMRSLDPTKKIMISPRYAGSKWSKDFAVSPELHARHFDFIFSEMDGLLDIATFMDGHVEFSQLEDYISATSEVCGRHGIDFWSNLESFDRDMPWNYPPIDWIKMRHKLEVAQPYVSKVVTFEAPHFLSPYSMYPSAHGLYKKYMEYIGKQKTVAESTPEAVTAGA